MTQLRLKQYPADSTLTQITTSAIRLWLDSYPRFSRPTQLWLVIWATVGSNLTHDSCVQHNPDLNWFWAHFSQNWAKSKLEQQQSTFLAIPTFESWWPEGGRQVIFFTVAREIIGTQLRLYQHPPRHSKQSRAQLKIFLWTDSDSTLTH